MPPASPASATTPPRYHHGDLKNALLDAAETLLAREGVNALTLREIARTAGVSHAAPKHHFGNLAGLLSELAARGYRRLGDQLVAAAAGGQGPAMGLTYICFAQDEPHLFRLMFGPKLDWTRPALEEAAAASMRALSGRFDAAASPAVTAGPLVPPPAAVAAWALVHGLAILAIDGPLTAAVPPGGSMNAVMSAALAAIRFDDESRERLSVPE